MEDPMARSVRVIYRNMQGRVRCNVNWPAITADTPVIVTAAEWTPDGGIFGILSGRPNLGAANVWVSNIGPHGRGTEAGGVEFHLHVEWGAPLFVVVSITVPEPFEQTISGNEKGRLSCPASASGQRPRRPSARSSSGRGGPACRDSGP